MISKLTIVFLLFATGTLSQSAKENIVANAFICPSQVTFRKDLARRPCGLNPMVGTRALGRIQNRFLGVAMTSESNEDGVLELVDDAEEAAIDNVSEKQVGAPFLSQGDISEEALNPDLSDPKQTRVIIYIIISLVPVLFLIPLMLGSRDLIPMDVIPPVEM